MKQLTFIHEIDPAHDLHERQLAGVSQLARAVGSTLGPRGRNVVIDRLNNDLPIVTKDGVTVSKHVLLADPIEHAAVKLVQHVAETVVRQAGDGTTTSIVLAEAIFRQGLQALGGSGSAGQSNVWPFGCLCGCGHAFEAHELTATSDYRNRTRCTVEGCGCGHYVYCSDAVPPPTANRQPPTAAIAPLGAIALQRALLHAGTVVSGAIRAMALPVETDEQILAVATIAMNGDTEVPPILVEAVRKVGREGMITLADSRDAETHLVIRSGYRIPSGFVNDQFISNPQTHTAVLENPLIFVTERLLTGGPGGPHDVTPICEYAMKQGRPLLIVCDDMVGDALAHIVQNHLHRGNNFRGCVVRAPGGAENRRANLSDLGMAAGAEVNRGDSGDLISRWLHPIKTPTGNPNGVASHLLVEGGRLGECARATITAAETVLEGCPGPKVEDGIGGVAMIDSVAADLLKQAADMAHQYSREAEQLRMRAARLTGRVAVIEVGASTEAAARPLRDSVEDAVLALRAALEEGIVPGGGSCLLLCGQVLRDAVQRSHGEHDHEPNDPHQPYPTAGNPVLETASIMLASCLESPLRQICRNAGVDEQATVSAVIDQMMPKGKVYAGYDAAADEVVPDMLARGIVDPAKVVRIAMEMALSVAALLLSTSCSITWLPQPGTTVQKAAGQ